MTETDDIVMVPVPRKHLNLIIQALAQAMSQDTNAAEAPSETRVASANQSRIKWDADNLRILRAGIRCEAPVAMLDMTAAEFGKPVYFDAISRSLNQRDTATRVQIGTLTKVIKRDFGVDYDHAVWPVDVKWDETVGKMYYVMNEETAIAWKESAQ